MKSDLKSKTLRTLYNLKILEIPVRPKFLEIPDTDPKIPEILKSGVLAVN